MRGVRSPDACSSGTLRRTPAGVLISALPPVAKGAPSSAAAAAAADARRWSGGVPASAGSSVAPRGSGSCGQVAVPPGAR